VLLNERAPWSPETIALAQATAEHSVETFETPPRRDAPPDESLNVSVEDQVPPGFARLAAGGTAITAATLVQEAGVSMELAKELVDDADATQTGRVGPEDFRRCLLFCTPARIIGHAAD
jgi:hypothetical protein